MKRTTFSGLGIALLLASTLLTSSALAEPKDREAAALAKQAMDTDYLGTQFKEAEQKLQKALKTCAKKCAPAMRAQIELDLAVVYIAGLKKKDKGKKAMQAAIAADASIQLNPDFTSPEIEKAYAAAGGIKAASEPAPPERDEDEDEPKAAPPPEAPADAGGARKNWLSLAFQQDLLTYQQTNGVCTGAAQYQCFLQGQSFDDPSMIYSGSGNQLQGGVGLATKRVLIGYERLLGDNLTAGVKLGFAFGGSPKATNGTGTAFLPFHAELRGSYWFGDAPFARDGLRGYAGVAVGFAEIDGHVSVEYYTSKAGFDAGAKGKLDAWRKTGNTLLGAHAGIAYAFTQEQQLFLELRLLQMLGATALGGAVSAGYSFGM